MAVEPVGCVLVIGCTEYSRYLCLFGTSRQAMDIVCGELGTSIFSKILDRFEKRHQLRGVGVNSVDGRNKRSGGSVSVSDGLGGSVTLPNDATLGNVDVLKDFPCVMNLRDEDTQPLKNGADHIAFETGDVRLGAFVARLGASNVAVRLSASYVERNRGSLLVFVTRDGRFHLVCPATLTCLSTSR